MLWCCTMQTRTGVLEDQRQIKDIIVALLEHIGRGLEETHSMPSIEALGMQTYGSNVFMYVWYACMVYMVIYMCMSAGACIYVACVCMCMYVYVCVCMCMYVYVCVCTI